MNAGTLSAHEVDAHVSTNGHDGPISTPMVAALENAWAAIRQYHPEVPAAVIVLGAGSIGSKPGSLRLGHFAAMRWHNTRFKTLARSDVILFWFPASKVSVQPIALYELGRHAGRDVPLAVGAEHGYQRRRDVVLQLDHARPGLPVWSTLKATATAAIDLLAQCNQ